MEMQGTRLLKVTQEQAWQALNDPTILKSCIPGCDKFELTEPNVYTVQVALRIGPVAAKFNGKVSLMDIVAPNSYSLKFDATGGIAGFGKGESQVRLSPVEGAVELSYSVQSQVGGKIAQLGQRLIDGVAKSLAEEFFTKFEKELISRHAESAQTDSELVAESDVPPKKPINSWVLLVALGLAAGFLAWMLSH
jgi:uncharacterized protein